MGLTFDGYIRRRQKEDDCGDPIGEEAYFDFAGASFEAADVRGVLKKWIRDIWTQGYKRGFRAGFVAREREDK